MSPDWAEGRAAEEVVVRLAGDQHKVRQLAKRVRDADERGGEVDGGDEEVQRVEERDVDADPGQRVEQAEGEQRRQEQPQKHGQSAAAAAAVQRKARTMARVPPTSSAAFFAHEPVCIRAGAWSGARRRCGRGCARG